MAQIATLIANIPQGSFPNNAEPNPKEEANVITFRSGRQWEQAQLKNIDIECATEVEESNIEECEFTV